MRRKTFVVQDARGKQERHLAVAMKSCLFACARPSSPVAVNHFSYEELPTKKPERYFALYTGENVRDFVQCFRCRKLRCVFAAKQLTSVEQKELDELKQDTLFTCGSSLLPPIHPLQGKAFMRSHLSCTDSVERAYYTCKLVKQKICHNCGSTDEEDLREEPVLTKKFRQVLPSCSNCYEAGIPSKTFLPVNSTWRGEKRKALAMIGRVHTA